MTTGVTAGDNGGGAEADSLMAFNGDGPSLVLLSDITEVTDAAADEFPGAVTDELPGPQLREARSSSARVSPQGFTLPGKETDLPLDFPSVRSVAT